MTITFDQIPATRRSPSFLAEFDSSKASQGAALLAYKALLIGQILATGTASGNELHQITSVDSAILLGGRGSMIHMLAKAWRASNSSTELWILTLDDDGAGVAATKTITVAGTSTADGVLALYLGGNRITVAVTSGDTVTEIAAAIVAAINASVNLPVTATSALGVVTVTARNDGTHGNDFDIRANYNASDATPAGITITVAAGATGAANPSLTTALDVLGETWFNVIAHPYTDATNLGAIEAFLTLRNGPLKMIDGFAVTSALGTHAELTSLGNGRNNRHSNIQSQAGKNPLTPPLEYAAEFGALVAKYGAVDPARPLQTLAFSNAVPPADIDLFDSDERELLLYDGIGTSKVVAGTVQIDRAISTYQTSAAGGADTAYLDISTLLTLMYLRYSWRTRMQNKYPRHKLASDASRARAGQKIMTPALGKTECIGWFKQMEAKGLVEGLDQFTNDLVVERDLSDTNRLNFDIPPDLMNQLVVMAAKFSFRL